MPSGVVVARAVFVGLGLVTASVVLYTCLTDGSPFRRELLTPWMSATLVDFYVNIAVLLIWLWYKEIAWGPRLIWTLLFCGLGSAAVSWYIGLEFFKLSPGDPVHLVLLRERRARKGG
eukprot:TRINITY_DN5170_c0_g1_i1.p2 TRINITY_DN5170_c0_g1~~TRINITY_DN5170_c0_g1_i1.p2  ORF type:complete len:118 (+),score=3.81 TRINITY_DN5170_c0_g1_i1:86-439(+)